MGSIKKNRSINDLAELNVTDLGCSAVGTNCTLVAINELLRTCMAFNLMETEFYLTGRRGM